jgi:hypothetical protein
MKHRNFRITWSVAWGVVAVLLCVLWVRSYWQGYSVWYTNRNYVVNGVALAPGSVVIEHLQLDVGFDELGWHFQSKSADQNAVRGWKWERGLAMDQREVERLGFLTVSMPTWFLCGLFLSVAAVPWHPFRFSLRTLLIATTLVAVALGFIVWASR